MHRSTHFPEIATVASLPRNDKLGSLCRSSYLVIARRTKSDVAIFWQLRSLSVLRRDYDSLRAAFGGCSLHSACGRLCHVSPLGFLCNDNRAHLPDNATTRTKQFTPSVLIVCSYFPLNALAAFSVPCSSTSKEALAALSRAGARSFSSCALNLLSTQSARS